LLGYAKKRASFSRPSGAARMRRYEPHSCVATLSDPGQCPLPSARTHKVARLSDCFWTANHGAKERTHIGTFGYCKRRKTNPDRSKLGPRVASLYTKWQLRLQRRASVFLLPPRRPVAATERTTRCGRAFGSPPAAAWSY